jgi:hypothetical protein
LFRYTSPIYPTKSTFPLDILTIHYILYIKGDTTMRIRKCKLTHEAIIAMYKADTPIKEIHETAGISRAALYNILKAYDTDKGRREILTLTCSYCEQEFTRNRSHTRGNAEGEHFCSVKCFHANRTLNPGKQVKGGLKRFYGRYARTVWQEYHKTMLTEGQVIHHIDGDVSNNSIKNLQMFENHSEHMKVHHRKK